MAWPLPAEATQGVVPLSKPPLVSASLQVTTGVLVAVGVFVGVLVGGPAVGVLVGVLVGPAMVTVRKTAETGPQVRLPLTLLTPRPRTNRICCPADRLPVATLAVTPSVVALKVPSLGFMAMAVPPAHGGVSM